MKNHRKLLLEILTLTGAALIFTGCQTIEGAGEDLEDAGDAISDAARSNGVRGSIRSCCEPAA